MVPVNVRAFTAITTLLMASASAETLTLDLRAGQPAEVLIDSPVDDISYQNPRGYGHHGTSTWVFIRKLTLTNTGAAPLTGPLLIANGRNWSSPEALRKSLTPLTKPRAIMRTLFAFWRDHHSHADSDCDEAKEPLALLNYWGYALCGDTTTALTRLATSYGIPARKIPLNGHVAAE